MSSTSDQYHIGDDEKNLLDDVAREEEESFKPARSAVEEAEAQLAARVKQVYPDTKMREEPEGPDVVGEEEPYDEFALPQETQTRTEVYGEGDTVTAAEAKEVLRDPFESFPPQRIHMAEMQKSMLRARLIVGHMFEGDKTPAGAIILDILKAEKPDVYADICVRVGMALYIGWQKGMGQ